MKRKEKSLTMNEADVIAAIDLLGRGDDPDELQKILKLWRVLSSSRKR